MVNAAVRDLGDRDRNSELADLVPFESTASV